VTPVRLVKWQGGKAWLCGSYSHLLPLPRRGGRAFDCTAGSCVIPFWYLRQGYRVVIGDTNARLIGCLRNLQRRAEDVISVLTDIADVYRKAADQREDFYARRECLNRLDPADVGASALFLFMLRAGFNGLWRENHAGECNTTWGDPLNVDKSGQRQHVRDRDLVHADELRVIARLLQRADIRLGDFEATSGDIRRGEALFADAPYLGTFTGYSRGGWTIEDRKRLAAHLRALDKRGVRWTATDSADHGALSDLGLWHVERVDVRRSGSCKAEGRGLASEVVVMNFQPSRQEAA
jgi:DNA adenine methylase